MQITGIRAGAISFAFSPIQEVLRAVGVFSRPQRHAEQMAWVREARRQATPALKRAVKHFDLLIGRAPEIFPDLFPASSAESLDVELARLRRSGDTFVTVVVRRMLGRPLIDRAGLVAASRPSQRRALAQRLMTEHPEYAPLLEQFGTAPSRVLGDFASFLELFFERCLARRWAVFQASAIEDAHARERLLKRVGLTSMLRTLTREVSANGTARKANIRFGGDESAHASVPFEPDSTLTLTPSYFVWPRASFLVLKRASLDVRIAYPLTSPAVVRSRAGAWEPAARRYAALGDAVRLQMLDLLADRELSTRELAGLVGLSEGGVSRHLSLLREAQLITSARDGYFVLYRCTALGARHVREPGPP